MFVVGVYIYIYIYIYVCVYVCMYVCVCDWYVFVMSVYVSVWVYQGLSSQCGVVSDWDGKKKRGGGNVYTCIILPLFLFVIFSRNVVMLKLRPRRC